MEDSMECDMEDEHKRTIIHIDIDCFYAQVEEMKNPELKNQPLGIQQKNIVVTCNYKAREYGVKKCMLVSEALNLCPTLILTSGEDLHDYRQASKNIHELLLSYTNKVEKLGMDENYLDVSDIVADKETNGECDLSNVVGEVYNNKYEECVCGCHERLVLGSQIAQEIRNKLRTELGFTSCAGVSYNKLLSKLVGSVHKPNSQTTLFASNVPDFMLNLKKVEMIPGIGYKKKHTLNDIGIFTVSDLQNCDINELKTVFDQKSVPLLLALSKGIDNSLVKQNTRPQSIGLEDGFKKISLTSEVKEKFKVLLLRLMTLLGEDGRLPVTVKVTVRKYDNVRKIGHRETKQCPVPSSLFSHSNIGNLSDSSIDKLLDLIMNLFHKIVNISKPFHLTLLGLAFTKFQQHSSGTKSIANFLIKERDISVQSVTSFVSDDSMTESPSTSRLSLHSFSPPPLNRSSSEPEIEPCTKKSKLDLWIKKRKREEEDEICSPSKLKVGDLSLCSDNVDHSVLKSLPQDIQMEVIESLKSNSHFSSLNGHTSSCDIDCPPDVDPQVFSELPVDVQEELLQEWRNKKSFQSTPCASKQSSILKYCISHK